MSKKYHLHLQGVFEHKDDFAQQIRCNRSVLMPLAAFGKPATSAQNLILQATQFPNETWACDVFQRTKGAADLVDKQTTGPMGFKHGLPLPNFAPDTAHHLKGAAAFGDKSGKVRQGVIEGGGFSLRTDIQMQAALKG